MRGQVGHADPVEPEQGVGEPGRQAPGQACGALGGPAEGGAAQQVRGSADGQADSGRAPFGEIDGEVAAGGSGADDQDVLALVGAGIAVAGGVQERSRPRLAARPLRQVRGVVPPGGDDHGAPGEHPAAGRLQPPQVPLGRGDPGDLDAGDDLQFVELRVLVEVADQVGAGGPAAEGAAWGRPAGPSGAGWWSAVAARSGRARPRRWRPPSPGPPRAPRARAARRRPPDRRARRRSRTRDARCARGWGKGWGE